MMEAARYHVVRRAKRVMAKPLGVLTIDRSRKSILCLMKRLSLSEFMKGLVGFQSTY